MWGDISVASRKNCVKKLIAIGLCVFLSPCYAQSFLDNALDVIADFANREKHVESKSGFMVSLPKDLPQHWKLRAFKEHVFGGEILVAEVGSSDKPTVFLVHGLGVAGMRDWLTVVPALEKDYHLILLDLPGFGASATPAGKYSPRNYARVIEEVKASLVPDKKVKVVGHSMGGAVTLRFAEKYPQLVSGIVLVDAAGMLERTAFLKHNAAISDDVDFSLWKFRQVLDGIDNLSSNIIEIVSGYPDVSRFLVTESSWAAVFGRRTNINAAFALMQENFGRAIEVVDVPVGIIWGEDDGIAPLRTGKLLDHHLANSSLVLIPGAEHMPMKSHRQTFNESLKVLLRARNFDNKDDADLTMGSSVLRCKDRDGGSYSGAYQRIEIDNCNNLLLQNIKTRELSIKNAKVNIENIAIASEGVALVVDRSTVVITNVNINADVGILANDSRLDIAGATIFAKNTAASATKKSRFIFSLSRIRSAYFSGRVHKLYQLENTSLDRVL